MGHVSTLGFVMPLCPPRVQNLGTPASLSGPRIEVSIWHQQSSCRRWRHPDSSRRATADGSRADRPRVIPSKIYELSCCCGRPRGENWGGLRRFAILSTVFFFLEGASFSTPGNAIAFQGSGLVVCEKPVTSKSKLQIAQEGMVAGLVSGTVSRAVKGLLVFPLDTLRVRQQARQQITDGDPTGADVGPTALRSQQTPSNVFAGWIPGLLLAGPSSAAFFAMNDLALALFPETGDGVAGVLRTGCAAAAGSVAGWTVRTPFEVVKTAVQGGAYRNSVAACRGVVAAGGLGALWASMPGFLVQYLPGDPIKFVVYGSLVARIRALQGGGIEVWEQSVCGAAAFCVVTVTSNPFSVANTRLILASAPGQPTGPRVLFAAIRDLVREEGVTGLGAGLLPRLLKAAASGALSFGFYEASKAMFR